MSDRKKSGVTKPVQMRLGDEILTALDRIAEFYGLSTRTEAVRFLVQQELKKPKKPRRAPTSP